MLLNSRMWGIKMRLMVSLAAIAATFAVASPALAAPLATVTTTAKAKGVVLQPLTLTKLSDLDFGWVISTAASGTVSIDADTGGRGVTGGVAAVSGQNGGRGRFAGAGTVGNTVLLTLNPATILTSTTNSSDTINVNYMTLDNCASAPTTPCLTDTRLINASGTFSVGVGGEFAIAANQPNGSYEADFDVTAVYQ